MNKNIIERHTWIRGTPPEHQHDDSKVKTTSVRGILLLHLHFPSHRATPLTELISEVKLLVSTLVDEATVAIRRYSYACYHVGSFKRTFFCFF